MQPTDREEVCDLLRSPAVREGHVDDRGREEQERPGEDDRHDARVIHLQRHVLRLAAVHLAADHALRVLHGDLALRLRHGDDRRDDEKQEQTHQDQHNRAHLAWAPAALGTKVFHAWVRAAGSCATMPTVMMSEIPLPIPRSVI